MIRMIRKTPNLLPVIAGIALMTISACASATSAFSKATQDAAIAAAVDEAEARAADAQRIAVDAVRCTDPICDNVVNADDLPSFPTAVTSNDSAFLTITGTEIDATGVTVGGGVAPTIRGATRAGDDMDGFRYFQGRFGDSGDSRNFAGILPTTNLGAPLTSAPAETEWTGTYSQGGGEDNPITFDIDFANRRITALDAPGNATAIRFDLGFSDSGLISGSAFQHLGLTGDENIRALAHVTGLIGTDGLVGVFTEVDSYSATGLYGGFVADNPDTNP